MAGHGGFDAEAEAENAQTQNVVPVGYGGFSGYDLGEIGGWSYVTSYGATTSSATRQNTPYSQLPDGGSYGTSGSYRPPGSPADTNNRGNTPYGQLPDGGYVPGGGFVPGEGYVYPADPFDRGQLPGTPGEFGTTSGTDPFNSGGDSGTNDQSATVESQLNNLRAMSVNDPEAYTAYLYRLWAAGFMGSMPWEEVQTGAWTRQAGDAFVEAAIAVVDLQASGVEVSFDDYLDKLITGRDKDGDGKPDDPAAAAAAPVTTVNQFTDPEALRVQVQSAAQTALGRDLTAAETDAFLASFRSQEEKYNADRNAAAADTEGGTFNLTTPDAGAAAANYAIEGNEAEGEGYQLGGYFTQLKQMMGV